MTLAEGIAFGLQALARAWVWTALIYAAHGVICSVIENRK